MRARARARWERAASGSGGEVEAGVGEVGVGFVEAEAGAGGEVEGFVEVVAGAGEVPGVGMEGGAGEEAEGARKVAAPRRPRAPPPPREENSRNRRSAHPLLHRGTMPSLAHDTLVDLFKNRPSLAAELLSEALHVALPSYTEARLVSIDLTQIRPAEYRADVVVLLLDEGRPASVLITEVQLGIAPRKRFTWPEYAMGARAAHGCPVGLLVVAPDPEVAAWCAEPIETGIPGFVLRPPVLGRESVPVVTDPEEAARRPELAVLSAMAHGEGELGAAIAAAVLPAVRGLNEEKARFYGDVVLNSLNEAARRALEAMMKGYEYQSDFAKKYYGQGRSEGRMEEAAHAVMTVLRVRGIAVPDAARERILAEKDPARLERWHERAILAASVAEVLEEPS
jgi:hypothetical protein